MNDTIFDESINAVKAKAFDALANQNIELVNESNRLNRIIKTWLVDCEECGGYGVVEKTHWGECVGEYDVECYCDVCKGTGKVPKE